MLDVAKKVHVWFSDGSFHLDLEHGLLLALLDESSLDLLYFWTLVWNVNDLCRSIVLVVAVRSVRLVCFSLDLLRLAGYLHFHFHIGVLIIIFIISLGLFLVYNLLEALHLCVHLSHLHH